MKLLCKLFDHKSVKGWCNGMPYFRITGITTDGIGHKHARLQTECERCGEKFTIGMVHLPTEQTN